MDGLKACPNDIGLFYVPKNDAKPHIAGTLSGDTWRSIDGRWEVIPSEYVLYRILGNMNDTALHTHDAENKRLRELEKLRPLATIIRNRLERKFQASDFVREGDAAYAIAGDICREVMDWNKEIHRYADSMEKNLLAIQQSADKHNDQAAGEQGSEGIK